MPNKIMKAGVVPTTIDYIKIGGNCYYRNGTTSGAYTTSAYAGNYSNCADCVGTPLCQGLDCTGLYNGGSPAPSIALTVSGASGTITWCGKTWNLPSESGVKKCVCPVSWDKNKLTTGTSQYAYNRWEINNSAYDRLRILRRNNVNTFQDYGLNVCALGVTNYGTFSFSDFVTFASGITGLSSINLGFIAPPTPSAPTLNDYQITDDFFGNYTHANGVTYQWERGDNW
jgi:hypothetical protein